MSVIIRDEERLTDETYSSEYPYIMKIEPVEASFYTAIGYSLLMQLSRIPLINRKRALGNLNRYLLAGLDQQVNPSINEQARTLSEIIEYLKTPEILPIKHSLKQAAEIICVGFQVILAQIFAASNKHDEAAGILRRELVIPANKYYFDNFAECLSVRIFRGSVAESPVVYMHERKEDKINISIYVTSVEAAAFAIMVHSREVEFDSTRNPALVNSLPFMIKQADLDGMKNNLQPILPESTPVTRQISNPPPNLNDYMARIGNSAPPDPSKFVSKPQNPYTQTSVHVEPPNPVLVPSNPVHKSEASKPSGDAGAEEYTLEMLCRVFNENSLLLSKKEAKKLRDLMKELKESYKKVDSEAFRQFYKGLKVNCKQNHNHDEYVILMKSCSKRHCKECLRSSPSRVCDCKSIISDIDCQFHLNLDKSSWGRCVMCDQPADEGNAQNINSRVFHNSCLAKINNR